jgi:hypothetical protein
MPAHNHTPTHASTQSHSIASFACHRVTQQHLPAHILAFSIACQLTIKQYSMTAHNHIVLHANTQSCSNACQHTITLYFLHTNTQSCGTACQHTVILYCIPPKTKACGKSMPAHSHTYCMLAKDRAVKHASMQLHFIACQPTTIHSYTFFLPDLFFINKKKHRQF